MKYIFYPLAFVLALSSCTKENLFETPCSGDCGTSYEVIYKNELMSSNGDVYYEIEWDDLNYF